MNGRTNHRYRPSLNDARCVVMLSGPHSDRRERSREQPEAATVLPERGRCRCCSLVRARIAAGRVDRHRSPRHDKTQNTQEANLPAPVACAARHGTTKGDQKPPEQDGTEAIARFLLSSARGRQGYRFAGRIEVGAIARRWSLLRQYYCVVCFVRASVCVCVCVCKQNKTKQKDLEVTRITQSIVHLKSEVTPCLKMFHIPSESLLGSKLSSPRNLACVYCIYCVVCVVFCRAPIARYHSIRSVDGCVLWNDSLSRKMLFFVLEVTRNTQKHSSSEARGHPLLEDSLFHQNRYSDPHETFSRNNTAKRFSKTEAIVGFIY